MLTSRLEAAQTRIRQRWYAHFSWVINESAPWAALSVPLGKATVALLSTCGAYRVDTQLPFDAWHDLGDPSFREIHVATPPDRLRLAHTHYDHKHAAADLGVTLPIQHFQKLAQEGTIGRLHPWAYSFMGYLPEPRQLIAETAPQVARQLAGEGVNAAFLTPCWPICQQSVGLIARAIEAQGIPSVCVVMNRDITECVKTPRSLFVRFPYGAPLGPAGNAEIQMTVIRAALAVLTDAQAPGTIVEADIEWPE